MKKVILILIAGLLLSGNAYAATLKEVLAKREEEKAWYKKIEVPGVNYFKKRKDCKDYADRADSVYLGKQRYETCMED